MKKLIVLLLMMLPLGVFAQEMKIAIVNSQEILPGMPEVIEMQKTLANVEAEYKKELQTMEAEYNKKYADFIAQQDSLTENIKARRMQELEDINERSRNFVQLSQQEYGKKQQELFTPIQEKLKKAITEVGNEKGYTYILDPQVVFFTGNSAIDATPFVKAKLGLK